MHQLGLLFGSFGGQPSNGRFVLVHLTVSAYRQQAVVQNGAGLV